MATDLIRQLHDAPDAAEGYLSGALTLAPIGIGAAIAHQRMKANQPINAKAILASPNSIPYKIGQKLAATSTDRQAEAAQALAADLMKEDGLQRMLETSQQQKQMAMSLLSTLEDPSSGMDQEVFARMYREKLVKIAESGLDENELKDVVVDLLNTVMRSDEATQARFAGYRREYKDIGNYLEQPDYKLESTKPFHRIDTATTLKGSAAKRYEELLGIIGKDRAGSVRLVSTKANGQGDVYAQIFDRPNGNYLTDLPLYNESGIFRTGENLNTGNKLGKHYVDLQTAQDWLRSDPKTRGPLSSQAVDFPTFQMRRFRGAVASDTGPIRLRHRSDWNASRVETTEDVPRAMYSDGVNSRHNAHLRQALEARHNTLTVFGMERLSPSGQRNLLRGLIENDPTLDPSTGADRLIGDRLTDSSGTRQYLTVGMRSGSLIEHVQTGGPTDRLSMRVTARLEQVSGRTGEFLDDQRPLGRGGAFMAGGADPIGYDVGAPLSGTINKAVVHDLRTQETHGVRSIVGASQGEGQAFGTRVGTLRDYASIPVLDPTGDMKYPGSKLLNRILKADGQRLRLSRKDLEADRFLGFGPRGPQELHLDPRTEEMEVWLERKADAHGKQMLYFNTATVRDMETAKLFGTQHKGIVRGVERSLMRSRLQELGVTDEWMKTHNIHIDDVIVTGGDILKKTPDFVHRQMISGFGLVSGRSDAFEFIANEAGRLKGDKTHRIARVVANEMAKDGTISAKSAGMVLAGVMNVKMKDVSGKRIIDPTAVETIIRGAFGNRADEVLGHAKAGMALAADAFSAGPGVGDFKRGRGSMESRGMKFLQQRLLSMGMETDEVADFMAGMYRRRLGGDAIFKTNIGLGNLMGSMLGTQGIESSDGVPRATLDDVFKFMVDHKDGSDKAMAAFLNQEKYAGGVVLDLASNSGTVTGDAIAASARKTFGGQDMIRLPGRDTLSATRGTDMKINDRVVAVSSEVEAALNRFGSGLFAANTSRGRVEKRAEAAFEGLFGDVSQIFSKTLFQLNKAKVKGSAMMVAANYDVVRDFALSAGKQGHLNEILKKTNGRAIFVDQIGFMSAMQDFAGTAKQHEVRYMMEEFFTGIEGKHIGGGLEVVTGRSPMLGLGHVNIAAVYRHLDERGEKGGKVWDYFEGTKALERAKKAAMKVPHEGGPHSSEINKAQGWGDVAKFGKKQRKAFFHSLAGEVASFDGWTGGGSVYQPRGDFELKVDGLSERVKVDLGLAATAGGDFDGDQWVNFLLDQKQRKLIRSTMNRGGHADHLTRDVLYKMQRATYEEAAKAGLAAKAAKMTASGVIDTSAAAVAAQDALKESASKRGTGPLDAQLNHVRMAILQNADGDPRIAAESLALLDVLEEHTTIKGKKLPIFSDLAGQATGATKEMLQSGETQHFGAFLRDEVFGRDSALFGGVRGHAASGPQYVTEALDGDLVNLDKVVNFIKQASSNYTSAPGQLQSGSAGQLNAALKAGTVTPSVWRDLTSVMGMDQAQMMRGFLGAGGEDLLDVARAHMNRINSGTHRFNMKAIGPLAAGVVGSLALSTLMGKEGYSHRAFDTSSTATDPRISDAIASGSMFSDTQGPAIDEMMSQHSQQAGFSGMVNTPTTYMTQPNAWQVRGSVPGSLGPGDAVAYMSGLMGGQGAGAIRMNDTRRPLTANYIDRLQGSY